MSESSSHQQDRFVSHLTRNTIALILAGGRGSRLKNMTDWRAKPAVPFGGKFRIIDFPLSNCMNSGIRKIGVLTQYKADSLIRHIQQGWGFLRGEFGEYVDLMPAQQRLETSWYEGTADAIYQNIDILRTRNPEYVLVLAGDHIYKMDYGAMLADHVANNADLTIGCLEVSLEEATEFGVMDIDEDRRVKAFVEKPSNPPSMPGKSDRALASMGIYVFNARFLFEQLIKDADTPGSSRDFGKDIIPSVISKYRINAYPFLNMQGGQSYWRDVGTIDAYWSANMELIGVKPDLNLYDKTWPIWTYQEQTPPAKFVFDDDKRRGQAVDSMVSGGCVISGSKIRHSLLFSNVRVNSYSVLQDTVVLPEVNIARHCRITKAIIEKGCEVPQGTVIGEDRAEDEKRFHVSPGGVVLVTPDMLGQNRHYVR
ncbi:MAG: glucose-1-phosphate adenylyltransferase [Methylicorpusculum sp.]|uniref:glucose-1-phosphate adenylyltransferase n=1 Tax=Methylicorpusculum sp. TaxID=2713644 RepID=UPI00271FB298|nr:glucose-1-phosphate adenylyltransferase [Methylicorpusculum sp.]MDO8843920.1 glucose-1-phosphate adenylyltransferase [Methylicorpusculum sp.]MDO8939191.1 glucose-1-phosphate adenylyltransferase [Methylicorpusculum sp.]MDO9239424.1 glucose-1-phosphate adenylyltransferase [Methylicorpusculum sp.]MDP2178479.1 glucose-1-phosphate adenylyltransferase [Methylicorpusculum sp.]MDP2201602.1 glucose-1-phosphate adenylyltransferase [Methylicorpusculum sp.]